jgi:uncharacterized protein
MCSVDIKRNIHDPIWGDIGLTEEEWQLLALPAMQRLRRIHQLGLTMLVFPGATHSRFEHSLGAAHAAGAISQRLLSPGRQSSPGLFTEDDHRLARLAGLLHDIGHGVFSHVSDALFARGGEERGHEWIGAHFIENDPAVVAVVGQDSARAISAVLRGDGARSVLRDVVSGPADADKLDYLLRDTYYTGVRHQFDHHHFVDQAFAIGGLGDQSWLGFGWSGLWSVEGMLLTRHHLHRAVYGHRNRLVTDYMLQRGLQRGMGAGPLPEDLLTIPKDADMEPWLRVFLSFDDWRVMTDGKHSTDPVAAEMFRRLRDHDLLKLLVYVEDLALSAALGELAVVRLETDRGAVDLRAIEEAVADVVGVDPDLVIARVLHPDHVFSESKPKTVGREGIFLQKFDNDGYDPFTRRSEVFSSKASDMPIRKLLVYAPMAMRDPVSRETTQRSIDAEAAAVSALKASLTR